MRQMGMYVRSISLGRYLYETMIAGRVFAMLLRPRNPKFEKYFKIQLPANRPFTGLKFGTFGLVAKKAGILKAEQIEAARMAMTRTLKKKAKIWTIPVPNKSYTKKPAETRMGKGKGPVAGWAIGVPKAAILFEAAGCSKDLFWEAARLANSKLPIKAVPIERE